MASVVMGEAPSLATLAKSLSRLCLSVLGHKTDGGVSWPSSWRLEGVCTTTSGCWVSSTWWASSAHRPQVVRGPPASPTSRRPAGVSRSVTGLTLPRGWPRQSPLSTRGIGSSERCHLSTVTSLQGTWPVHPPGDLLGKFRWQVESTEVPLPGWFLTLPDA